MGSLSINSYNRRDSFGLGWADQWDYKFNDEKLAAAAKGTKSTNSRSNLGKENKKSCFSEPNPQKKPNHQNLLNKKKMMDLNRKVLSVANNSAVVAKSAANTGAHKVKAGTSTGIKWLKKQCSLKALK
eukprot:c40128_g1_i1 orf=485-868(-)